MTRMGGTKGSPRIHLDGHEEESFPLANHAPADHADKKNSAASAIRPAALDSNRLRRLSFGARGLATKNVLPALDRTQDSRPAGPLVPLPLERPKFHHGEARLKRPKVLVRGRLCTQRLLMTQTFNRYGVGLTRTGP